MLAQTLAGCATNPSTSFNCPSHLIIRAVLSLLVVVCIAALMSGRGSTSTEEIQHLLAALSLSERPITVNIFLEAGSAHHQTSVDAYSGQASASLLAPSSLPEPQASITLSEEERTSLARSIGRWVSAALDGHRGAESGRSKNKLGSRFWLVFKDFDGTECNPVRVFNAWNKAKPLVKREGELGNSLCIGMPTIREAQIVVAEAGKRWPTVIH